MDVRHYCNALSCFTCRILTSLAVADMLTGLVVAPLHVVQYVQGSHLTYKYNIDNIRRTVSVCLLGASIFSIGFIAYDRFVR